MKEPKQHFISTFDFERHEFTGLLHMVQAQLNAGRDIAVQGCPAQGWTLSIAQNRDATIRKQYKLEPAE